MSKIEIRVGAEAHRGRPGRHGGKVEPQGLVGKPVGRRHAQLAGVALVAVRARQVQHEAVLAGFRDFPEDLVEPGLPAVQRVRALVARQRVGGAVELKRPPPIRLAVRPSSPPNEASAQRS